MDVPTVLGLMLVAGAALSWTRRIVSGVRRHRAEATTTVYRHGLVEYGQPSTVTFGCAHRRHWHDRDGRVVQSRNNLRSALTLATAMVVDGGPAELDGCEVRLTVPTRVQPGDITRCEVHLLDGRVRVLYLDPQEVQVCYR